MLSKKAMAYCLLHEAISLLRSDGTSGWVAIELEDSYRKLYNEMPVKDQDQVYSRDHNLDWVNQLAQVRAS